MIIKSLSLTNFQLFENATVDFQKLNIISGINRDNPSDSGNASGKSTLSKHAITFLLYGKVEEYNISDLIRLGNKKTIVEGYIQHKNNIYHIIREIPTHIEIYINDSLLEKGTIEETEILLNNDELKQKYLDSVFGDYKYFRQFRIIDTVAGIDLLNQTDNALRKTLMSFVEDDFTKIRNNLLKEKNQREQFSIDKRPYPYYLSDKKKTTLKNGLDNLIKEKTSIETEISEQENIINQNNIAINSVDEKISNITNNNLNLQTSINNKNITIKDYKFSLDKLKVTAIDKINIINYAEKIQELENDIKGKENKVIIIRENEKTFVQNKDNIKSQIASLEKDRMYNKENITKLQQSILDLNNITTNSKCDKCGAVISIEKKEEYAKDQTIEINKLNSDNENISMSIMKEYIELNKINTELEKISKQITEIESSLNLNKKELKELISKNLKQTELIGNNEKERAVLSSENKKYQDLINNMNIDILEANSQIQENNKTLNILHISKNTLNESKSDNIALLTHYNHTLTNLNSKISKTERLWLQLNEAFKFIEYRYTPKDILLYDEAKKILDTFASDYIEQWLSNLKIIINNLLEKVNMKANFTNNKNFIEITENGRQIKYCQLSGAQKTFLGTIFKLAILLFQGLDGIVLADDGLTKMDIPYLMNFIEVCKNIPLQIIIIYQNCPSIEDSNKIIIERLNNKSEVL